jgi:hypothetical protein
VCHGPAVHVGLLELVSLRAVRLFARARGFVHDTATIRAAAGSAALRATAVRRTAGQPSAWQRGQPPFPQPGQGQPPYPPSGPGAYPPPEWQQPPAKPPLYKRPWFIVVAALVAIGLIGSALGGTDDDAATPAAASSTVETTAPSSSAVPPPATQPVAPPVVTAPPTTEAAPAGVDFVMPDFVGLDLQTAQNMVQTYNIFFRSRTTSAATAASSSTRTGWSVTKHPGG